MPAPVRGRSLLSCSPLPGRHPVAGPPDPHAPPRSIPPALPPLDRGSPLPALRARLVRKQAMATPATTGSESVIRTAPDFRTFRQRHFLRTRPDPSQRPQQSWPRVGRPTPFRTARRPAAPPPSTSHSPPTAAVFQAPTGQTTEGRDQKRSEGRGQGRSGRSGAWLSLKKITVLRLRRCLDPYTVIFLAIGQLIEMQRICRRTPLHPPDFQRSVSVTASQINSLREPSLWPPHPSTGVKAEITVVRAHARGILLSILNSPRGPTRA